jgi:hypothetical protein
VRRGVRAAAVVVAIVAGHATSASADVAGWTFERGWFAPGDVNGQAGWSKTFPYDVAVVGTTVPGFGAQSLRAANDQSANPGFVEQAHAPSVMDPAGEASSVSLTGGTGSRQSGYDLRFQFRSAVPAAEQPGLQVQFPATDGRGSRMSLVTVRDAPAGLAVAFHDTPSPECASGAPGCVAFRETIVATGLARADVHSARLTIDFVDGPSNDVVQVFVDGTLRFTGTSWENYYRNDPEQAPSGNLVPTVDTMAAMVRSPGAGVATGNGLLIDNVRVETSTPEDTAPPQPSPPPPSPPPPPGPPDGAPAVETPMRILAARMSRRTGIIRVRLRCPSAAGLCTAAVTIRGDGHVRFRRELTRPGGRTVTLHLKPTRANRGILRRARKVTITVTSRNRDGIGSRIREPLPRR